MHPTHIKSPTTKSTLSVRPHWWNRCLANVSRVKDQISYKGLALPFLLTFLLASLFIFPEQANALLSTAWQPILIFLAFSLFILATFQGDFIGQTWSIEKPGTPWLAIPFYVGILGIASSGIYFGIQYTFNFPHYGSGYVLSCSLLGFASLFWILRNIPVSKSSYSSFEEMSFFMDESLHVQASQNEVWEIDFLRQALDMQKRRNQELRELIFETSHDLCSPLSSILGLIHIYHREDNACHQKACLDKIEAQVLQLNTFIKRSLDQAKDEEENLRIEKIDAEELIRSCLNNLAYMPGYNEVDIHLHTETDFPFYSDLHRLQVICSNLISNAVKYRNTDLEKCTLNIHLKVTPQEVFLDFCDNGLGIKSEYLNRIFDLFMRANQQAKGTGVGLYIVKQMVDKLGGRVQLDSTFGEGTQFHIQIPNRFPFMNQTEAIVDKPDKSK